MFVCVFRASGFHYTNVCSKIWCSGSVEYSNHRKFHNQFIWERRFIRHKELQQMIIFELTECTRFFIVRSADDTRISARYNKRSYGPTMSKCTYGIERHYSQYHAGNFPGVAASDCSRPWWNADVSTVMKLYSLQSQLRYKRKLRKQRAIRENRRRALCQPYYLLNLSSGWVYRCDVPENIFLQLYGFVVENQPEHHCTKVRFLTQWQSQILPIPQENTNQILWHTSNRYYRS